MVAEPLDRPVGTPDRVSVGRRSETAVTATQVPGRRRRGGASIPLMPPGLGRESLLASSSEETVVYNLVGWTTPGRTVPRANERWTAQQFIDALAYLPPVSALGWRGPTEEEEELGEPLTFEELTADPEPEIPTTR